MIEKEEQMNDLKNNNNLLDEENIKLKNDVDKLNEEQKKYDLLNNDYNKLLQEKLQ